MTATSSALADRTVPPSVAAAAAPVVTCPNAPKRTFVTERFIARPMRIVSSVPEAPTSIPLTIRTLFSSSKPVAAAASRGKAFSSEITPGMSAPPIGSTKRTPNTAAQASSTHISHCFSAPASIAIPAAIAAASTTAFSTCCPGYVIGRPLISSWSFAKATIDPANEIEPITAERKIARLMSSLRSPLAGALRWNSAHETNAAAPPPTLPALEHLEHSIGHDEAADHVRRAEDDRDEADHPGERVLAACAHDEH